jgi:hypothetical protein
MEPTQEEVVKKTRYDFFFSTPLYEPEPYTDYDTNSLFSGEVNGYNHLHQCDTTFSIDSDRIKEYGPLQHYRVVKLTCKRFADDTFEYFVYDIVSEGVRYITKVGQFPSLADISNSETEIKYSKNVNREHLSLFKKAVGLAAHGAGAGSFVYLRRIFEDTISTTHSQNLSEITTTVEDFRKLRMADKVKLLKNFLPDEMSEFKNLYSILSDGVHNMSEEDCKKYFPALKLAIEVIWDGEIERREKEARKKLVASELETINNGLAK